VWGRSVGVAMLAAATFGVLGCDDGPDVTRPLEGVDTSGDPAALAEFCDKLTSQGSYDPTSRTAAQDAVEFLDDLLSSTPEDLKRDVTTLRDTASKLAGATSEQEARRIAREELDPGVFTAYTRLETFRTEGCR
jgi:hypothetical protein